ncbi:ATP-binding cassette domain-containing protein [Bacillus paralicheniformis]|uniref:ATP-binding cassette domain-containing protein n=1 Tax=Bacillus paralicheniformis TaxID=1648923 RepID=UPI00128C83D8|nr:excinuclease ABC subunit UvrA [Bacillus paralicheniformis]MPQ25422.1 ATP-binding cassette domain-containing protein [Bacillus paralicheniformis]
MVETQYIKLVGLEENNLKNVTLTIPKKKITVFTGVSGSGKSSIVFDTISKEAQRQLNQTFSTYIQNRLPTYSQPDALSIENLSPAVVIDQRRLGGNIRSTLGTVTDIYSLLRLLFSRIGKPFIGESDVFSFNNPKGMCPKCQGIGQKVEPDIEKLFDKTKSINEGAILFSTFSVGTWYWQKHLNSGIFNPDKKLLDYTDTEWQTLLHGKDKKIVLPLNNEPVKYFEGVVDRFRRMYLKKEIKQLSNNVKKFITITHCTACNGTRLSQEVLNCKIDGCNIAQFAAMEVGELIKVIETIKNPIAKPIISNISSRLHHLMAMGLYYLTLNRETSTLSGGESQRVKVIRHLNSSLTDMMYIFDEPSTGLHPRDVYSLNRMLQKLRDKGNTVIVVEHDKDVIKIADHIVDIGPGAGTNGGEIVYEGNLLGLYDADTLTGKYMRLKQSLKKETRKFNGYLSIVEASKHNLKNVTAYIPCGVLTVITGVAGSGKSTLIFDEFLEQHPDAVVIDQKSVSTSIRSTPATYTGIMDAIRYSFASANKVSKSLFSFNSKGACPECQGNGFINTDLAFLESIRTTCETCNGKRFTDEVLQYKLDGKSISDVLDMTVLEALQFFREKDVVSTFKALSEVGLDYMTLGQPLNTLSGGECQRIKLAGELHRSGNIYVLDEPTTGLHMSDVRHLLSILNRLVDNGSTVIVIEHNLDIMKQADWIIDLGPGGGKKGGEIMFTGTPHDLVTRSNSLTAQYLRNDI